MATVVSFINMKGGVGKTTLAMQISLAAARASLRVLAVDLDPQSNLSQALMGLKKYKQHLVDQKPTVIQVFEGYMPSGGGAVSPSPIDIRKVILSNIVYRGHLHLVPSRLELSNVLRNPTGKERRLAKAIARVADDYDLVVIDCAPTDSVLTDAAYFSSRYVIVPIKPEFMATIGLPLLAKSLNAFKMENEDHEVSIAGIAFVHSSSYSSGPEARQSIEEVTELAKHHKWPVFETQMRYSASYAKSAREGSAIDQTSHVRWETALNFSHLRNAIFASIGIST